MPEMNYIALVQARVGCRDHVRYYADGTCPKCGRAAATLDTRELFVTPALFEDGGTALLIVTEDDNGDSDYCYTERAACEAVCKIIVEELEKRSAK